MLVVGITGGIGSGKTAVSDRFGELGVPVIDTDVISKELVEPGLPAFEEIVAAFGSNVVGNYGRLNRAILRKIVFEDPSKRQQLEEILHVKIRAEVFHQLDALDCAYCVIVIPLLAESKRKYPLDRILVVDASADLQLARAEARGQQSREELEQIIRSQATREERLALADDVIENSGSLDELHESVNFYHQQYVQLAKSVP